MESSNQTIIGQNFVTTVNGRQLIRREDMGPGYWTAESDRGIIEYLVIMNPDFQYCTCPDNQYRGRVCKHMKRVMEVS